MQLILLIVYPCGQPGSNSEPAAEKSCEFKVSAFIMDNPKHNQLNGLDIFPKKRNHGLNIRYPWSGSLSTGVVAVHEESARNVAKQQLKQRRESRFQPILEKTFDQKQKRGLMDLLCIGTVSQLERHKVRFM
jgi:hypothetical protein